MFRTLVLSALLLAVPSIIRVACQAQSMGSDSLFLFYPHSRLIVNRTAIVSNTNILYADAGPGHLTNVRLGGILMDRFEGEAGLGFGDLRQAYGWSLRGGIIIRPPVFVAASIGSYTDKRREYDLWELSFFHPADTWRTESTAYTPAPGSEGPETWMTYITKAQIHVSALPHKDLLLSLSTGYTSYNRDGVRSQIPLSFGVMYQIAPIVLVKGEAELYSRQEELQNTSGYIGLALLVPNVSVDVGFVYHKGYMREGATRGFYVCAALYY